MSQAALLLEMRKHKTSHVFHLLMSIITMGFWLIIWALCAMSNGIENAKIDKQINKLLAQKE